MNKFNFDVYILASINEGLEYAEIFFYIVINYSTIVMAQETCESLNNKIEDKTKYIVYEKVIEIERSLAVGGTQFIKSKKIPEYQSEISLLMQQANSMNCPAYTGDLTGKPYAKFAQDWLNLDLWIDNCVTKVIG